MLGDGFDNIKRDIEKMREMDCLATANQSAAVKEIDARTADLASNWNPTGFYTASDIRAIVNEIVKAQAAARVALATAAISTGDATSMIRQAVYYLDLNAKQAQSYLDAAAKAGSGLVDAPGLKQWVLRSMVNISHAYTTVAALSCRMTWLDHGASLVNGIYSVAKTIAGAIADTGVALYRAAEDIGLGLSRSWKYIKWGGIGLGALFASVFIWNKLLVTAESGRKAFTLPKFSRLFSKQKQLPSAPVSGSRRARR